MSEPDFKAVVERLVAQVDDHDETLVRLDAQLLDLKDENALLAAHLQRALLAIGQLQALNRQILEAIAGRSDALNRELLPTSRRVLAALPPTSAVRRRGKIEEEAPTVDGDAVLRAMRDIVGGTIG